MTFYKIILCILFAGLVMSSCENSGADNKNSTQKEVPNQNAAKFPELPIEIIEQLKIECDLTDFIFFDLPISMSQDNQSAIQQVIGFISPDQATHSNDCKAVARVFFAGSGESLLEADLFFNPGCQYFLFYDKGKPIWANNINTTGINFFQQVISSAQTAPKGQ